MTALNLTTGVKAASLAVDRPREMAIVDGRWQVVWPVAGETGTLSFPARARISIRYVSPRDWNIWNLKDYEVEIDTPEPGLENTCCAVL